MDGNAGRGRRASGRRKAARVLLAVTSLAVTLIAVVARAAAVMELAAASKFADGAGVALDHEEVTAVGAQPLVGHHDGTASLGQGGAQQRQRAARGDPVAGDRDTNS
jgi:hypothetical protein